MVLPIIPAVLIAVGAVTGGGGLALGGKGALDFKRAQAQLKDSANRYRERRVESESRVAQSNELLHHLGENQKDALAAVVLRMADFLRRNEKQVRENERLLVDGIDAAMSRIPNLTGLDINAASWIVGAIGSAATAAGTGAGVLTAAGNLGIASTGVAISGLSGVAAESATMAFLGGGSLATGGGGMALGATALNFVTIGPALLIGGFVTHSQADKAVTKAPAVSAQVEVEIARLDEFDAKLITVDTRTEELRSLLADLRERATKALDVLESEPFNAVAHADRFQTAMMLTMAVRDVAAAPVVEADGELSGRSEGLTVKYRTMTEGKHNA